MQNDLKSCKHMIFNLKILEIFTKTWKKVYLNYFFLGFLTEVY